jgi:hypothetical protein
MMTVAEAVTTARVCPCNCYEELPEDERARGIAAVYVLDDALRGWGYVPTYEQHGDRLWREAQKRQDPAYRGVAVRFNECIYRRLLGSLLHECLHAISGDVTKANYGVLYGLPYSVPVDVPEKDEEAFLAPFNAGEARAWVGVWIVSRRMFGIDWDLRTARDVGTYGFVGGNALIPPLPGYRAVAHIDRQAHAERYYARGRKLEAEARAWFDTNLDDVVRLIEEAAALGAKKRPRKYPEPTAVARIAPRRVSPKDPCICGSSAPFRECCGAAGASSFLPSIAR